MYIKYTPGKLNPYQGEGRMCDAELETEGCFCSAVHKNTATDNSCRTGLWLTICILFRNMVCLPHDIFE